MQNSQNFICCGCYKILLTSFNSTVSFKYHSELLLFLEYGSSVSSYPSIFQPKPHELLSIFPWIL